MIGTAPMGTATQLEPNLHPGGPGAPTKRSAAPMIVAAARRERPNDPVFPLVCLAIASGEGGLLLPTPSGDSGSSFGPFQLHEGGALPSGKGEKWANSQAGINYAVHQISLVAPKGSASKEISGGVTRFERPRSDLLAGEIQGDVTWYKAHQAAGGPPGLVPGGNFPNPGGALGKGSGTIAPKKFTPGLFDCSGSDSFFFGLVQTPSTGAIGCYLLGALKLVGMAVLGGGLALAGFYLILPRSQGRAITQMLPGSSSSAGSSSGSRRGGAAVGPVAPPAPPLPDAHREAMNRARLRTARANARTAEHKARQAKANTGTSYSLSPSAEASLRRAQRSGSRRRPDRMAG